MNWVMTSDKLRRKASGFYKFSNGFIILLDHDHREPVSSSIVLS